MWAGWVSPEAVKKRSLVEGGLFLCLHMVLSLPTYLLTYLQVSSSYKDTSPLGLGHTLMTLF